MKILPLSFLLCASLSGQGLTFFLHDPANLKPDTPLPSTYQFADTPIGGSSDIVVRMVNPTLYSVLLGSVVVQDPSSAQSTNFTVTGVDSSSIMATGTFKDVGVHFTPAVTGARSGALLVAYSVQNACPSAGCPGVLATASMLQGTGTPAELTLTCNNNIAPQCNGSPIQPNSASPLVFGAQVLTTTTAAITFTLTNDLQVPLDTQNLVSLSTEVYNTSPFALDTSTLPGTLAPNSSGNFTVTFAPGVAGMLFQATLVVGSNQYPLAGTGASSISGDISSLAIYYVDQNLVRLTAQPATPIAFSTPTLTFTVTNPQTIINAVVVPNLTVSGAGFTLSGAPVMPATIQPGQSITFQIAFSESTAGTYSGTLLVGTRPFSLTALAAAPVGGPGSALPGINLICGASPCSSQTFTSQQQVQASLQLSSPSSTASIVQLAMTFSPLVIGITDDPAVTFISPLNARNLPSITFASGSEIGDYAAGQSQFTFQTGTTAGTITFTLSYLGQQTTTWTIPIARTAVQIASITAVRQSPNLVVTLNGYDNTYSVGQLSFKFYDPTGKLITTLPVDATPEFHQYFFGPSDVGGGFSAQPTFVVNGDVTQIGSVTITLTNTVGSTTISQPFQ